MANSDQSEQHTKVRALISIHDVMPETLAETRELIEICRSRGVQRPTLLVVPGRDWSSSQIAQLKSWQTAGCELAGHGWRHEASKIGSLRHRLHSYFISRNVAEHLSLTAEQIAQLIDRNANWFESHDLHCPELYVPPAWAMGDFDPSLLQHAAFQLLETTTGVRTCDGNVIKRIPLVGFEADTFGRATFLRAFNSVNLLFARRTNLIRVSIHPYDHRLRLASQLHSILDLPLQPITYGELLSELRSSPSYEGSRQAAHSLGRV